MWGWAECFVALFSGYIVWLISDSSVSPLQIFVCAVVLLTSLFVYIAYTIGIPYWRERSPPTLVILFIVGHWILINVVFHYYYALTTSAGHPPQVTAVHSSPVIVLKATVIYWLSWHVVAAPVLFDVLMLDGRRFVKARPTRMRFSCVALRSVRCVHVYAGTYRDGSRRNAWKTRPCGAGVKRRQFSLSALLGARHR